MSPSRTALPHEEELPEPKISYDINLPYKAPSAEYLDRVSRRTEFPDYLPTWEPNIWFDEVPKFDFHDPASRADRTKPHLLRPGVTVRQITPKMGTILTGVKMQDLSHAAKDELALLIVERKIVVLRDQSEFLHAGPQFQEDFMSYYGKLSYQPVSGTVKGFPAFHIIHRDSNEDEIAKFFEHKLTSTLWHQDVSYERQPPGYIMLGILACPDVGGDTVFADTVEAYKRLSPTFQSMIDGLKAIHSSEKMITHAKANKGLVRSDAVDSIHPIVRVHPVTGERSIYLNGEFLKGIVGLKQQETDLILKFLIDHICMGHDFQARVQWDKHSVVMFDGRTTLRKYSPAPHTQEQLTHIFHQIRRRSTMTAGSRLDIFSDWRQ